MIFCQKVIVMSVSYKFVVNAVVYYYCFYYEFLWDRRYISIENPLHKQSEKACMCFKTRWASTCNYMVYWVIRLPLCKFWRLLWITKSINPNLSKSIHKNTISLLVDWIWIYLHSWDHYRFVIYNFLGL